MAYYWVMTMLHSVIFVVHVKGLELQAEEVSVHSARPP